MTAAQIDKAKAAILAELPRQIQIAGADLAALVKQRVVQTGINANGVAFSPYSDKAVPAYLYKGRSRSGGADAKIAALAKKGEQVSYREFREINGLKTDKKNFEFTGEMWRGVEIKPEQSGVVSTAVITGGTQDVKDKLRYATEAEKISILKPNAQESAVVQANLQKWLTGLLNEILQ